MKQRTLVVVVVGTALIVNGVGFAIWQGKRKAAATMPVSSPADDVDKQAMARRAAGVAALEAGQYDKALIQLTEARSLIGARANVDDLLRITEDLRAKQNAPKAAPVAGVPAAGGAAPAAAVEPSEPVVVAPPAREPVREPARAPTPAPARPSPRPARASPRVAVVSPEPAAAAEPVGLLVVSTVPRGLVVQLDGELLDITPLRATVKTGSHRLTLLDGERRVYEGPLEVKEGVNSVLKDVTAELAATKPAPAPTPAPAPAPVAAEPAVAARVEPVEPKPAAPKPVAPVAPKATTGGLDISAPGLYAEVWINGRPYGFSPVTASSLPAGPAKIELRVNGMVKRTKSVTVIAGETTPVKVR